MLSGLGIGTLGLISQKSPHQFGTPEEGRVAPFREGIHLQLVMDLDKNHIRCIDGYEFHFANLQFVSIDMEEDQVQCHDMRFLAKMEAWKLQRVVVETHKRIKQTNFEKAIKQKYEELAL